MNEIWKKIILCICFSLLLPFVAYAYAFTNNMTIGSSGPEVIELQNILIDEKFLILPIGISKGYFGNMTAEALRKYQIAHDISPASGYFGPITRMYVNTESMGQNTVKENDTTTNPDVINIIDQQHYFGKQVTETPKNAPLITEVSVTEVSLGDRITVYGKNFGSKVTIYSSLGILKDKKVRDDGSVIFNLSEIAGNRSELSGLPVSFSIGTSKGVSSNYGYVMVK
jgi:peptidoglycan hydrolase-like protein with peptidoglycan-binding domain